MHTHTYSWNQGEITNFEYLMELNKLSGRTFNDLMQYPVFPFILANYQETKLDLKSLDSFRYEGGCGFRHEGGCGFRCMGWWGLAASYEQALVSSLIFPRFIEN